MSLPWAGAAEAASLTASLSTLRVPWRVALVVLSLALASAESVSRVVIVVAGSLLASRLTNGLAWSLTVAMVVSGSSWLVTGAKLTKEEKFQNQSLIACSSAPSRSLVAELLSPAVALLKALAGVTKRASLVARAWSSPLVASGSVPEAAVLVAAAPSIRLVSASSLPKLAELVAVVAWDRSPLVSEAAAGLADSLASSLVASVTAWLPLCVAAVV